jgi:hypothetical protein
VSSLVELTVLGLDGASVTDVSPLTGLRLLTVLVLDDNSSLTNIRPLIDNTGIGRDDTVHLNGTEARCDDVATLTSRGVIVFSECS